MLEYRIIVFSQFIPLPCVYFELLGIVRCCLDSLELLGIVRIEELVFPPRFISSRPNS